MTETKSVKLLNTQPTSILYAWCVVLTAALFFFYIFIQMNLFNAISPYLIKEFQFSTRELGYLAACYFYGTALFRFPAGILLDRLSVRHLLLSVFAITIAAAYVFSTTSTFWLMSMVRLTIGLSGAFALLSAVKLASRWFEPHQMARAIGAVMTMSMIGGAIAQVPLAMLTQHVGWRHAIQIVAALGIVLLIIQFIVVQNEPKKLEKLDQAEQAKLIRMGFWQSLGIAVANVQNWLCGVFLCFVSLPILILGASWGSAYLIQVHHFTLVQATIPTTMFFIGMMIGSPLIGFVSDKIGLRKLPMLIGATLSLLILLTIMFSPTASLGVEAILFALLGFFGGAQAIGYPFITESNPHAITGVANGLGSTLTMSGGMLIPIFGWLLDYGHSKVVIHSVADFNQALSLMAIGLIIAIIAACFLKETYCKRRS